MNFYFRVLITLLCTLSLNFTLAFSQKEGKLTEGYFISKSNDTIKGFIDYKEWNRSPHSVTFSNDAGSIILTPSNSLGFHVEGSDTYIAYNGKRMTNPFPWVNNRLNIEEESTYEDVELFLRVIVNTDKGSLLELHDSKRTNFFLLLPNTQIIELQVKSYMQDQKIVDYFIYRHQFQQYFGEEIASKKLTKRLALLQYNDMELKKFMLALSDHPGLGKENSKKRYPGEMYLMGGMSFNSYSISPGQVSPYVSTYSSTISPVIGIGANFYRQRNFGRYLSSAQLKLFSFKAQGEENNFKSTIQSGLIINLDVAVGANIINRSDLKWHIGAGGAAFYLAKNTETLKYLRSNYENEKQNGEKFFYGLGLQSQLLIKRRVLIWANYHLPIQLTNYIYYSGNYSSLQAGVGYCFKR